MVLNSYRGGILRQVFVMSTTENFNIEKDLLSRIKITKDDKKEILEVGFFSDAKYTSGVQVAAVARYNEFGTSRIPPRPFFRSAVKQNRNKWSKFLARELSKNLGARISLQKLGEMMRSDVIMSITRLQDPPNSPKTIKRKKSSKPLIDTGTLRRSVQFHVRRKI